MPLMFRPARAEDVPTAQILVVGSINDLTERHGFGPMASVRPANFQLFSLQDDADGQWIAEDAGQIVGCAFSWVCDDLWFLAELFIAPDRQGQGIGNELLKRTLEHASKRGASKHALITFTFNRVSQGLYIRHGLFPRLPIYFVGGARDRVSRGLPPAPLHTTPIENSASHLRCLAQIDGRALGLSREKHHRYLIGDTATQGVLLHAGDECIGYAYVAGGHVGPLAVTRPQVMGDAFTTALHLAAADNPAQVSAFLPGASDAALAIAIAQGMRITFPMVLVSARDFGNWDQYLPRNPGFM